MAQRQEVSGGATHDAHTSTPGRALLTTLSILREDLPEDQRRSAHRGRQGVSALSNRAGGDPSLLHLSSATTEALPNPLGSVVPGKLDTGRNSFHQFLCQKLGDSVAHDLLPRRLRILGHVAVLWLEPEAIPAKARIGQVVLEFDSKIRSVLRRTAPISGPFRQPAVELIAGDAHTETAFRENRCTFHLDPMKVMFSIGNKAERARMSQLGAGELVIDMFAGIGQFSIPMAVHAHPRLVHAIEWNPDAFHYLQQNIEANRVTHLVTPHLGDTGVLAPQIAQGNADRVLMGLIQGTTRYFKQALACLHTGGILHVHEIGPRHDAAGRTVELLERAAQDERRQVTLLATRTVKTFSPGWNHFVIDARIDEVTQN